MPASVSDSKLPETIYHYTDIHGLQGIYEDGVLWATDSYFLNDTSEVSLGMTTVGLEVSRRRSAALERVLKNAEAAIKEGGSVDVQSIRAADPEVDRLAALSEALNEVKKWVTCYVASLSEEHDQLSQWRGYAKDGYCIALSTDALSNALQDNQKIARVHYLGGNNEDDDFADRMIRLALEETDIASPHLSDKDNLKFYIGSMMAMESAFSKDWNFSAEREVRIVQDSGNPHRYTPGKFGMTPRVEIPLPDGAVTSVTIGPSAHSDLKARSLVNYFHNVPFKKDQSSLSKPSVELSRIPFRDW